MFVIHLTSNVGTAGSSVNANNIKTNEASRSRPWYQGLCTLR